MTRSAAPSVSSLRPPFCRSSRNPTTEAAIIRGMKRTMSGLSGTRSRTTSENMLTMITPALTGLPTLFSASRAYWRPEIPRQPAPQFGQQEKHQRHRHRRRQRGHERIRRKEAERPPIDIHLPKDRGEHQISGFAAHWPCLPTGVLATARAAGISLRPERPAGPPGGRARASRRHDVRQARASGASILPSGVVSARRRQRAS